MVYGAETDKRYNRVNLTMGETRVELLLTHPGSGMDSQLARQFLQDLTDTINEHMNLSKYDVRDQATANPGKLLHALINALGEETWAGAMCTARRLVLAESMRKCTGAREVTVTEEAPEAPQGQR